DQLGFISVLAGSIPIADGATVARVKIHTKEGRLIEREVLAGRDTAEWAYDHADVKPVVKHSRARIAESWDAGGFSAHRYLSRFTFDRAQIEKIEVEYALSEAVLVVQRASLYDTRTGQSTALDERLLSQERWRWIGRFGQVALYENLKFLPRAWFVRR